MAIVSGHWLLFVQKNQITLNGKKENPFALITFKISTMSKNIIVLSNGNKLPTPIADNQKKPLETAFFEAFKETITFESATATPEPEPPTE